MSSIIGWMEGQEPFPFAEECRPVEANQVTVMIALRVRNLTAFSAKISAVMKMHASASIQIL